jgi:hypothetical protein
MLKLAAGEVRKNREASLVKRLSGSMIQVEGFTLNV